jgi:hypothetical protein
MANTLSVTDMVLKEAQRIAHEKLAFITTTDLQYDKSFRYDASRGPNGQSIRIREPNQYTRRQGSRVMDVQDQNESTQTFTVATQDGVDMRFNSAELMQSVNSGAAFDDLSKTYIEPAISVLCSGIEGDYIDYCTKRVYNLVGTAGTPPTDLVEPGEARAKLNQNLAPKDGNRFIQADSVTMGGMVNGLSGLFHDGEQIKKQYKEGMMGRTAMADWYENDRMATITNSSDVTGLAINQTSFTLGLTSLTIDGAAAAPAEGMVFTIDSVFAVHPETKAAYSHLQQFVVGSGSTTTNLVFTPAIYWSGAKQNVSASPANDDALVWVGAASTGYLQNLMYHKEAFQFATVDLPIMDDAHKCVTTVKDNLSMRCWQGSDIRNDELLMRIDILYGMAALRPAWACRITN